MKYDIVLIFSYLVGAAFGGVSLLKAYEEFKKGVEKKSRIRIWSAFFILMFTFMIFTFGVVRSATW
jgi:hypothetical protein